MPKSLLHYAGVRSILVDGNWKPACMYCGAEVIFGQDCPILLRKARDNPPEPPTEEEHKQETAGK